MPDAVEAVRQDVQQKAAHELMSIERHDLLAPRAAATVIFVVEGDADPGAKMPGISGENVIIVSAAARNNRS